MTLETIARDGNRQVLRHSWTPSREPSPASPRIGEALRNAGCITEQQLQASIERQERFPYFTLGQLVSLMHRIPMARVDVICVQVMVLPLVGPVIMKHLLYFASKDRFAKNLDPMNFITEMHLQMLNYEVMHIDARSYSTTGEERERDNLKRYVLTQGEVKVQMATRNGPVQGRVRVRHDSTSHVLEIAEDQDQIKTSLYYGLRMKFNKTGADVGS